MTLKVNARVADLPKLVNRRTEAAVEAIVQGARMGAHRARGILVRATPTDTGNLRASWEVIEGVAALRFRGQTLEVAAVVNRSPYAGVVEKGARPHPVSPEGMDALRDWAWRNRAKFGIRRGRGARAQDAVAQVNQIAHAIAWKLRHHGQEPTYFVRDSLPAVQRAIGREIRSAVRAMAGRRTR